MLGRRRVWRPGRLRFEVAAASPGRRFALGTIGGDAAAAFYRAADGSTVVVEVGAEPVVRLGEVVVRTQADP